MLTPARRACSPPDPLINGFQIGVSANIREAHSACFRPPAPIPIIACREGSRFSGQSGKSLKQLHVYSFVGIVAVDLRHLVDVIDVILAGTSAGLM
jgi:hypothetical protein